MPTNNSTNKGIGVASTVVLGNTTGGTGGNNESVFIGQSAGNLSVAGSDFSTALGTEALGAALSGANNVAIGRRAGVGITSGTQNIIIGARAFEGLTTGGTNIGIGYFVNFVSNTASNQLKIGEGIWGTNINTATTATVGIGAQSTSRFGLLAGGSTTKVASVGGKVKDFYTTVGNVDLLEDDLYTYTTEASILGANGDEIEGSVGGVFVSSGTATRQLKMYFAGTAIFTTGALTISSTSSWLLSYFIIRVSATVVRYRVTLSTQGASLAAYTSVGELTALTLSNTNIWKITGEAAGVGAATNDITATNGDMFWWPTSQ